MGKIKLNKVKRKRSSQGAESKKVSVDELRRTLGLPDGTEFLGYTIYREKSDEFLSEFKDLPKEGLVKITWTQSPVSAACYKALGKAVKISEECLGSVVVGLFDTGSQIITVNMSGNFGGGAGDTELI